MALWHLLCLRHTSQRWLDALPLLILPPTSPGQGVLKELTEAETRYILFIDDIHNVTGPNAQQGGGVMDASVLLKPLLSRGELRCIG